jgi:hypothetical protein
MDSEKTVTPLVYAPNLHLFAFHLWRGLTGEPDSLALYPKQLWKTGDDILKELGFEERLHIPGYHETLKKESDSVERLHIPGYHNKSPEPPGAQINLHPQKQLELTGKLPGSDLPITGLLFTHRLYDSYSLTLNLRRPERENGEKTAPVPISFWQDLNTEKLLFLPQFVQSSLGQTLLLTAFLPESEIHKSAESLQDFARECVKQVSLYSENPPPLQQLGKLFGSPIFEFGGQVLEANMEGEAQVQPHILLLLFRTEFTRKKFVAASAYREFINLFFYRNKVISTYQKTRILYYKIYSIYTDLEKKVKSFKQELEKNKTRLALSKEQLEDLKQVLKELAQLDLEYARLLRNYKHSRNTIAINTKNYQVTLEAIVKRLKEQGYGVKPEEMDFFRDFASQTSAYFQSRISDELNYFVEGSSLADKAIASIRGIVEIEQTQRDRRLEQQNQDLQDQIQAVGVGIATGAIIASTSALIFQQEPMTFPWEASHGDRPHPFIWALLLSFALAFVGWGLAKLLIKCSRKGRSRSHQDTKN